MIDKASYTDMQKDLPTNDELKNFIDKIADFLHQIAKFFDELKKGFAETFSDFVPLDWSKYDAKFGE